MAFGVGYDLPEEAYIWRTARDTKEALAKLTMMDARFRLIEGVRLACPNGGNIFFGASVSYHPLRNGELQAPQVPATEAEALARPVDLNEAGDPVATYYALYRSLAALWMEGDLVIMGRGQPAGPVPADPDHAFLQPPAGAIPVHLLNANLAVVPAMVDRLDDWEYCGIVVRMHVAGQGLLDVMYALLDEGMCDVHVITLAHAVQYARSLHSLDVDIACDRVASFLKESRPCKLSDLPSHVLPEATFFLSAMLSEDINASTAAKAALSAMEVAPSAASPECKNP